jgi:hypothetical protein
MHNERIAIINELELEAYLDRTGQWLCISCQRPYKPKNNRRICQVCIEEEE